MLKLANTVSIWRKRLTDWDVRGHPKETRLDLGCRGGEGPEF